MGTRVLLTILLPALGVATLSLSLVAIPDVSLMAELGRDAIVRASTRWPPAAPGDLPDVAIVAIDGQSLQALPDWPWPREYFTRMISDLDDAGARAIAFDIDFSTPRDPDQDRELAATIASSEKVVLGAFHEFELIPNVGEIERAVFPTPQLAAGATLSASMVPLDPDGRVRRARASTEIGGRALPSMALAALETAVQPDRHVEHGEPFAIDYRRAFPPPTILSAIDLIEGRLDPGDVQGKVVLVGATAPILQDLWSTPMGHSVPGVLIQATEYRHHAAVMAGLPVLVRAGLPAQAALVTLAAVLSLSVGGTGRRRRLGISAVGVALLPFQILLCVSSGWLLEPVSPLAAVLLSYLLRLERIHVQTTRLLRQRERSLGAFLRIGRIAADRLGPAQAEVALELLGEVTQSSALTLLTADGNGSVGTEGFSWQRSGPRLRPEAGTAQDSLNAREVRLVSKVGGSTGSMLYVPLVTGQQPIGVLVAAFEDSQSPGEDTLTTIEAVAALVGLALAADQLVHDLRGEKERAEAASRAKSEFLANMSHEIRIPMAAVLGYTELLGDAELDPSGRAELIEAVRSNGEHMLAVINDLLDATRHGVRIVSPVRQPLQHRPLLKIIAYLEGHPDPLEALLQRCIQTKEYVRRDPESQRRLCLGGSSISATCHCTLWIMRCHRARSGGVTNVIAVPVRPARPVRPMRCVYSSISRGTE